MPIVGGRGFAVEFVETASVPESALYEELRSIAVQCDTVRRVRLQFDCVSSCFGGRFDDSFRGIEFLAVVAGEFGYDKGWLAGIEYVFDQVHGQLVYGLLLVASYKVLYLLDAELVGICLA